MAMVGAVAFFFDWALLNGREMFDWMDFVVMENLPLQFVYSPNLRRITKLKPVSVKMLRKNLFSLAKVM